MRLAATVDASGERLAGLVDGSGIVIWDTREQREERKPNPALGLSSGRRLAVVDALLASGVDVVCAVPRGFCTVSHEIAREAGLRFVPLEAGTPLQFVRDHAAAFTTVARDEMPSQWLDEVAGSPGTAPLEANAPVLSDATVRALSNRLGRLEGQVRGVRRLIEDRQAPDQVLTQLCALRSALNAVSLTLLVENLAACLTADEADPARQASIEAAKRAFLRLN